MSSDNDGYDQEEIPPGHCMECGGEDNKHERYCFARLRMILGKARIENEGGFDEDSEVWSQHQVAVLKIDDYNELVAVLGGAE